MLIGAHTILYSKDPEADRAFLRDVLGLPHVDVGGGWLIFALPPAEIAVHPAEENDVHELYFMCADVAEFVTAMAARGVACDPVQNLGWGMRTTVVLPGGGKLGVYEPRHARPAAKKAAAGARGARAKATRAKTKPGKRAKKAAKPVRKSQRRKVEKKGGRGRR
ncbi:MAG: hypothetical protein U1E73_13200 [Planctomycetota bacterium]